MLFNYIEILKFYFLLLCLGATPLLALNSIDISEEEKISLLEHSEIYMTEYKSTIEEIINNKNFKSYDNFQLNTGLSKKTIWINFKIKNSTDFPISKVLVLRSSLLEHIVLYTKNRLDGPRLRGISHLTKEHFTLYPFYHINLEAGQTKEYYLEIKSRYTPINFSVEIRAEKEYLLEDRHQQLIKVMLLSMIAMLMFYFLLLSIYMQDKSYFFYSFYLLTLLYQQGSYLGLNQIYFPLDFIVNVELRMGVTKVALIIISSSLFGIFFLKIATIPVLHRIYKIFIGAAIAEILFLNTVKFYNLGIVVMTLFPLVIFNLVASIISYRKGNKQARLYIAGFSIVGFAYLLLLANTLGLISILHYAPNVLIWGTTIEALVLSLAFADRYKILQELKEQSDKNREEIIKNEVTLKTEQLNRAVKTKSLLLKEVHHRVKNNLQIILSMIRLQSDKISEASTKEKFLNLENRINAISKTYNMLIFDENLDDIDMEEYIESLLFDIEDSMLLYSAENIKLKSHIKASLPLGKAVYIGIIINELITNAYKHAFDKGIGKISVELYQKDKNYLLIIADNGKGFIYNKNHNSLGLKLIHTLVLEQLKGEIDMETHLSSKYTITFQL